MANRRTLILDGAQAASDARESLGLDLVDPVDIYAAAEAMGLRVRFVPVNMEGFYRKGTPPRILLSAHRPLARKAFTCAHEMGHHWFGHGSTIDELQADDRQDSEIPEEIMANAFAAFMLMPTIGVRRAFNIRGWKPATVTPPQLLAIASEFGVGYTTLLTHLGITLRDMPDAARAQLGKWTPQRIRERFLGHAEAEGLAIVDTFQRAASVDLEEGYALAVPSGSTVTGAALAPSQQLHGFDIYRAVRRGVSQVECQHWKMEARVAPEEFVGSAPYRFLEDPDE